MTKHTPGPWEVRRETAIDYRPNHIVGADGGSLVAWCAGGGPRRAIMGPEEDANARLIAAAPDLLDALEELRRCAMAIVGADTHDSEASEAFDMYFAAQDKARAAIVKAEGRS